MTDHVNKFTADEARELTAQGTPLAIAPLLEHVNGRIKEAARRGEHSLAHPLHGFSVTDFPGSRSPQTLALWSILQENGFTVKHHPDPDPGHPGSGPYTEITW